MTDDQDRGFMHSIVTRSQESLSRDRAPKNPYGGQ